MLTRIENWNCSGKDKEIELLKQRDSLNTDSISSLSDKMQQIMEKIKELEDRQSK
jgi:gas vesicle protein